MKHKSLVILTAFTILLACSAAATQPPDPEWKVYQSDDDAFSFEYPAVYDLNSECAIKTGTTEDGSFALVEGLRSELYIFDDSRSAEEYIDQVIEESQKDPSWSLSSKTNQTVGNTSAVTIEYRFGGLGRSGTATVIKQGSQLYLFNQTAGAFCDFSEIGVSEIEAYKHMLDTFTFTK